MLETHEQDDFSSYTHAGVQVIKDVPYRDSNHEKHYLDVYSPKEEPNTEFSLKPVVVHIHGGGWQRGGKTTSFV